MAALPALDSATVAQIVTALAGMQPQELVGALDILARRHGLKFALTVSAIAGAIGATGQAAPAQALEVAGLDPAGLLTALRTDTLGNLRVGGQFAPGTSSSGPPAVFPVVLGAVDFSGLIQKLRSAGPAVAGDTSGGLYTLTGNSARPTYSISVIANPTSATWDLVVIEAPAGQDVRLRRIILSQPGSQTAASMHTLQLLRTTAAGAGGVVTPQPNDAGDGAYGGTVRANGNALAGALGVGVGQVGLFIPAALAQYTPVVLFDWTNAMGKAPRIVQGVANGITLRDATGGAGAGNLFLYVEFETANSGTLAPP